MWFIFQTAIKTQKEKNYFLRGRKFWDNSLWRVCKITFFYFFKMVPRNPILSDSSIQKAGKLASKTAGKLSTDLNNLPTCLIFIGAVESTDILMEVCGLCRLSITQKKTGRKHQPSISTNLLTSTNQKKQISLAGKHIQYFFLWLIWETSRLIHKGFQETQKSPRYILCWLCHYSFYFLWVLWFAACQDYYENPQGHL